MITTIIVAFFSLIFLLVIHEFGHFIIAKRFGVRVDEFGIGYPPRIFGKKIGKTLYSINLLPFGAFVKMPGEVEKIDMKDSFSSQPVFRRILIVLGGVISFWIISAILFSIVFVLGAPVAVNDNEMTALKNPRVQVALVAPDSPAQKAGLMVGDTIKEFKISGKVFKIEKIKDLQELSQKYKGKKAVLTIERGKELFEKTIFLRESPPSGQGPMGIALIRTALKSYPWYQASWQGIKATFNLTIGIIQGYAQVIKNLIAKKPAGVQLMGPVGVMNLFNQAGKLGVVYFLQFIGMIAIYLAIFNILPIPAVDGGKFVFLLIEAIRKKPVPVKVEERITTFFFGLLIILMIWVTIKDIRRIF